MSAPSEQAVARDDVTVKMDAQTIRKAKMVAAALGITLAEYLTEIVRPIVDRNLEEQTRKFLGKSELAPSPKKRPKRTSEEGGSK